MDRSADNLGQIINDIQRDLEELKTTQIRSEDIPEGAITTEKLADNAVTNPKLDWSSIITDLTSDITLSAGWTEASGALKLYKLGNIVVLNVNYQRRSSSISANSWADLLTLPQGTWPSAVIETGGVESDNSSGAPIGNVRVNVQTTGVIRVKMQTASNSAVLSANVVWTV